MHQNFSSCTDQPLQFNKKHQQPLQAFNSSPTWVRAAGYVAMATFAAVSPAAKALEALEAPTCVVPPKSQVGESPLSPDRHVAALQRMLGQLTDCQKDPVFLAALGHLLNSQERYLEAAEHLERALMLEPDLKDAQLSYAIALTGSGDLASAKTLLDNLLNDADLPPVLRPLIARQKALLANGSVATSFTAWQKRFTLATRIGYDSNLLGSPNLTSLPLTFAGQTIVLALDDNYLARPAAYLRADAQMELGRSMSDGTRWDAVASLRTRYSPVLALAGSTQVDLLVERSNIASTYTPSQAHGQMTSAAQPLNDQINYQGIDPSLSVSSYGALDTSHNTSWPSLPTGSSSGSYLNASASSLNSNSGTRFVATGVGGGWGIAWRTAALGACQSRTGLELHDRKYLDNKVLSGRYTGVSLTWSCENVKGAQLLMGFKAGRDYAVDASRPGGNQQQTSLRVGTFLPQLLLNIGAPPAIPPSAASGARNGLSLDFELSQQRDFNAYSPIIDSGRSRNMFRTAVRVEYQYAFSRSIQGVLGAEWVGQTSNIELFRLSSKGVYSGLRLGW